MNPNLQLLRQRLEHEDNLINQRLSWLVGSQSFLITAFAISLNAPKEFYNNSYIRVHERLLHLLPFVSIASIVVLMITLWGAIRALTSLRKSAERFTAAEDLPIFSPHSVRFMGLSAALVIPLLFLSLWAVLWYTLAMPAN